MTSVDKTSRIDMKHGFMKSIIKNQVDRPKAESSSFGLYYISHNCASAMMLKKFYPWDTYDKEIRATNQPLPRRLNNYHHHNRPKRPDAGVYIPPKRTEDDWDEEEKQLSSDDDDMPKRLFCFEFEDKDGKIYKQYVMEGVRADILASRMGYDRQLTQPMIKALEQRLQEEIDKRTKS